MSPSPGPRPRPRPLPLPTPRTILTALFNALPSAPTPNAPLTPSNPGHAPDPPPVNLLQSLAHANTDNGEQTKKLFVTLHAIFPALFLPALDLLDRGLVTRLVVLPAPLPREASVSEQRRQQQWQGVSRASNDGDGEGDGGESKSGAKKGVGEKKEGAHSGPETETCAPGPRDKGDITAQQQSAVYYVRSARPTRPNWYSRPRATDAASRMSSAAATAAAAGGEGEGGDTEGAQHYEVRPRAWNCSCPAFAFAAFASTTTSTTTTTTPAVNSTTGTSTSHAPSATTATTAAVPDEYQNPNPAETSFIFGGLGRDEPEPGSEPKPIPGTIPANEDGTGGTQGAQGPPICKHLLACVLAERCGSLGAYVQERRVGAEEAAGWGAGWGD
ncbi:MAG: hypothetical protein M1819_001587 [Sarea resinae]|nr:MAG: hypothetical protein M1819_001587 [Sarea resinae]